MLKVLHLYLMYRMYVYYKHVTVIRIGHTLIIHKPHSYDRRNTHIYMYIYFLFVTQFVAFKHAICPAIEPTNCMDQGYRGRDWI